MSFNMLCRSSIRALRPSVSPVFSPFRTLATANTETSLKPMTISRSQLKLIPDNSDLTDLERQDMLVRRQAKEASATVQMKKLKPVSPGLRWWRKPIYPYLWKGGPIKALTKTKVSKSGRNNTGRITVRHRGGGHQRRLRLIDFERRELGPQTVVRIEYDPNRSSHIALLKHNKTGKLSYIIACDGLRSGDVVESYRSGITTELWEAMGRKHDPAILNAKTAHKGNCLPISMIPSGAVVHNVGETRYGGAKYCRSAGTYARIVSKIPERGRAIISLASGEQRYVNIHACATIGIVSNVAHLLESWGKAGRSRHRGIRPTVRGVAMNKCDHPMGGGRGKSKSNKLSCSPWGVLSKGGYKTRRGKNQNKNKVQDRPRGKEQRRR